MRAIGSSRTNARTAAELPEGSQCGRAESAWCRSLALALLVPVTILTLPSVGSAQAVTFTKIVDTNTPIPGGSGNFDALRVSSGDISRYPAISNGKVVFWGRDASAAQGIYVYTPGSGLSAVADSNTAIPGGTGNFALFSGPDISGNNIVFTGDGQGIYTSDGITLDVVADISTAIPDGVGNFTVFGYPSIDGTDVAFKGSNALVDGVYTHISGVLSRVADTSTAIPGGTGSFTAVVDPDLDDGAVAFVGLGSGQQGIYSDFGGALAVVQDRGSPVPSTTVTANFKFFGSVTMDDGVVTFRGDDDTAARRRGVYEDSVGTVSAFADRDTPIPSGSFNFGFFGEASTSDGAVAFRGTDTGVNQQGIYTNLGGSLINVVNLDSVVDGKMVADVTNNLQVGRSSFSGNEIVFYVEFTDGSAAIYVATIGCAGDINGTGGADNLTGTAVGEEICGQGDDDRIVGAEGDDVIDGGTGIDTAVYAGPFCDYTVVAGDPVTVTDNVGTDGADSLASVEFLEFADITVDVSAVPTRGGCDDDDDGLTNDDEASFGTDPGNPDTDNDGLSDGDEVDAAMGSGCPDPLSADSDGDLISDGDEVNLGIDPCAPDFDDDGDGVVDALDNCPAAINPGQEDIDNDGRGDPCDNPVAESSVEQLTDIGTLALVRLDGSGSSDPDNDNSELTFAWTVDSIPVGGGATLDVLLSFGTHVVELTVTDPEGAPGSVSTSISLDPGQLAVFEIDTAKVDFGRTPGCISLTGEIGLPFGVNFSEVTPILSLTADFAGINVVPPTTTTLQTYGWNQSKWKYFDTDGPIRKLDIDWDGARYRYRKHGFPVRLKSHVITTTETVLNFSFKRWQINGTFSMDIDGLATVDVDEDGEITANVPFEIERPRMEATLTLPFPLTESSVITLSGAVQRTIQVADDLKASVGRFRLKADFDTSLFPDGAATTPQTLNLFVTLGDEEYPGAASLGASDLRVFEHTWRDRRGCWGWGHH